MTAEPVTVVVVTFRAADFLAECLDGLQQQSTRHRLLVVDNASTDGTADLLASRTEPMTVLRLPGNTGFAGGVATALPAVRTRFVALLNDDAVPDPDWLEQLLAVAVDDPAGAAWTSLMVLARDQGRINNVGAGIDDHWYGIDVAAGGSTEQFGVRTTEVFGFCGGAALLRTDAVRAVGGFPAEFFLYYEDLDTSWRLRQAGWTVRAVPTARVVHRHAASSDRRSWTFHFHNERNRLWMLIRCAPLRVAFTALARFALTTASLAAKRLARRPVADEPNFRVALRLSVLASVVRAFPRLWWSAPRRQVSPGGRRAALDSARARPGLAASPAGPPPGHRSRTA